MVHPAVAEVLHRWANRKSGPDGDYVYTADEALEALAAVARDAGKADHASVLVWDERSKRLLCRGTTQPCGAATWLRKWRKHHTQVRARARAGARVPMRTGRGGGRGGAREPSPSSGGAAKRYIDRSNAARRNLPPRPLESRRAPPAASSARRP